MVVEAHAPVHDEPAPAVDETDAAAGRIGWNAPIARALRGAAIGDVRRVTLPAGERQYEVIAISYP